MHAGACKWLWPWGIVESGDELAPGRGLGTAGVEMCVPDGVIAAGTSVRSPASLQLRACDPELLQPWPLVCSGDVNAYFQDSCYNCSGWRWLPWTERGPEPGPARQQRLLLWKHHRLTSAAPRGHLHLPCTSIHFRNPDSDRLDILVFTSENLRWPVPPPAICDNRELSHGFLWSKPLLQETDQILTSYSVHLGVYLLSHVQVFATHGL